MEKQVMDQQRHELVQTLEEWLDLPMLVLSLVWLVLLVIELIGELSPALDALVTGIWLLFVLEFTFQIVIAPDKSDYLKRNWLVALSLLAPALRIFRLARLLSAARAARTLTLVRVVSSLNYNLQSLREVMQRRGLGYLVAVTVLVVVLGAAGIFYVENQFTDGSAISSYGYALWWTAMLMTTLGADYTPQSVEGRILTFGLALYATGVFGYITATLASYFVGRDAADESAPVAGAQSIERLHEEIRALREEVRALRPPSDP